MIYFSPLYVSKHIAIIMLLVLFIHGSISCGKSKVPILF